jgi:uncharacterized protein (DUF58 family)
MKIQPDIQLMQREPRSGGGGGGLVGVGVGPGMAAAAAPELFTPPAQSPYPAPEPDPAGSADFIAPGNLVEQKIEDYLNEAWILVGLAFALGGYLWNKHPAFIALGIGLLLTVSLGRWWRNHALRGVSYRRAFDRTHVFPGEPITMTLTTQNAKQLPLTWLQFYDRTPVPPDSGTHINRIMAKIYSETARHYILRTAYTMQSNEQISREMAFIMHKRGFYRLGPVRYRSGDLFTLYMIEHLHDYRERLIVYPQLWPLEELELPAKELFGELKTRRSLFTDPIKTQGIRDYQPQDRFRDVHWKASARRGSLQSKVYDPSTGMTVVLFLNVATFAQYWLGIQPELLEKAVSVTASLANYCAQQEWSLGLYANGSVPNSDQPIRVRPGRSPAQLLHVLEALAAVIEIPTGAIEKLMQRESPRLPWAATFVLVTPLITEEMVLGLMNLARAGRRLTMISLAEDPPPDIPGVLTYHIPPSLPAFQSEIYSRTATEAALHTIITTEPVNLILERTDDDNRFAPHPERPPG